MLDSSDELGFGGPNNVPKDLNLRARLQRSCFLGRLIVLWIREMVNGEDPDSVRIFFRGVYVDPMSQKYASEIL